MNKLLSDYMRSLLLVFMIIDKSIQICEDIPVLKPTCEERSPGFLLCYDLIPETIINGTTHVEIICLGHFRTPGEAIIISNGTFMGEGWNHVQSLKLHFPNFGTSSYVILDSGVFIGLDRLIQLRLHLSMPAFGKGLLRPINQLKLLDLSNCLGLKQFFFQQHIFSDLNVVPQLETLILHNLGIVRSAKYNLNETFWRIVSERPVTYLDISGMKVNNLDVKAFVDNCDNIRYLNISDTSINKFINKLELENKRCNNLEVINATRSKFWAEYNAVCKLPLTNIYRDIDVSIHVDKFAALMPASTFIFHFCDSKGMALNFYNFSATFVTNLTLSTKHVYVGNLNVPVFDATIDCTYFPIGTLWLTDMYTEFFPAISKSCTTFMLDLNLSGNRLEVMRKRNSSIFDILFHNCYKVQRLYLKRNGFTDLPANMFSNNRDLQILDLSDNLLTQIHFRLMHLNNLTEVNLSNNRIKTLDSMSIDTLKGIAVNSYRGHRTVVLGQNPLQCSKCQDRNSIEWILRTDFLSGQHLVCSDGKRGQVISEDTLNSVIDDCYKVIKITLGTTIPFTVVVAAVIASCCIYRRQLLKRRIQNVRERLQNSGFVVFLSFSQHDDEFVTDNVFNQMDQELRHLTNIDRTLICTGDNNFRYGIHLQNAITECLEKCTIFIPLVTDSFLQSEFCKDEYDRAVEMKLPIILMVKSEVNHDLMRPHMLQQFMRHPRILWEERGDGRFVLRSSWGHVCHSILKCIDFKQEDSLPLSFYGRLRSWWRTRGNNQVGELEEDDVPLLQAL